MRRGELQHNVGADMDEHGNHRLVFGHHVGSWQTYRGIAELAVDGTLYLGFSEYWGHDYVIREIAVQRIVRVTHMNE